MIKSLIIDNIPTKQSNGGDWVNWHKSLRSIIGRKNANEIFKTAWKTRGTTSANDSSLRKYLEGQGLQLQGNLGLFSDIADFKEDTLDLIGDIFSVGAYVGIAIAGIMVVGLGMIVYNIAKSPNETIKVINAK